MKLLVDTPPDWRVERSGTWTILISPHRKVRVEVSPLFGPSGFDPRVHFEHGVVAPRKIEAVQLLDEMTTRDGWPMKMVTMRVLQNGEEGEWRLGAAYTMAPWVGLAVARAKSREHYDAARPALLEILGSARPHLWGDEPVCLAELYFPEAP